MNSEMNAQSMTMLEKLKSVAPYNIFYNTIPDLPKTSQENTIVFGDLLCPSLGELKCSLQITFNLDIQWLVKQYEDRNLGTKPLTILYGEDLPDLKDYVTNHVPNVTAHCVTLDNKFGTQHCKMGIYVYDDDSLRVVVSSSANLVANTWDLFNHSFWISPLCPRLPQTSPDSHGESPTDFKSSLLNYLQQYNAPAVLNTWLEQIKRADFSAVRVFLVTSFPGSHAPEALKSYLDQVGDILRKHCSLPDDEQSWPIITQSSNMGKFGESPKVWLRSTFLECVSGHTRSKRVDMCSASLKIIYPTYNNVKHGHVEKATMMKGLRYLRAISDRQKWLYSYLHHWRANRLGRSGIMPHTKTYCRISPCLKKMAWFLLTSANLNKGAWGSKNYHNEQEIYVRNYELGVMFLPIFFGESYFNIDSGSARRGKEKVFPLMYDLPLMKYGSKDHPWTVFKIEKYLQKFFSRDDVTDKKETS